MLQTIAWLNTMAMVGMALAQFPLLWAFVRALRSRPDGAATAPTALPKTAVILCLRGRDPLLDTCLRAILNQDYPDYEVFFALDSEADPAWALVEAVRDETNAARERVVILEAVPRHSSLKCASLVQVVTQLDDRFEVVALLDADTQPHRTWLRELVEPLTRHGIGAATGNRWYMPQAFSWSSLQRYLWNANAVVQMYCFRIPWGGSLAIRRDVFRRSDLLDRWRRAFCEDTMVYAVVRQLGLQLAFVPSLIMVNREDCRLSSMVPWVRRQLLAARLYHPHWRGTVLHGALTAAGWVAALGLVIGALYRNDVGAVAAATAGPAIYLAILLAYLPLLESAVRSRLRDRGLATQWLDGRKIAAMPLAALLFQGLYPLILLSTLRLRHVHWRGIDYRVAGSWDVRLIRYQPCSERTAPESGHSL